MLNAKLPLACIASYPFQFTVWTSTGEVLVRKLELPLYTAVI